MYVYFFPFDFSERVSFIQSECSYQRMKRYRLPRMDNDPLQREEVSSLVMFPAQSFPHVEYFNFF